MPATLSRGIPRVGVPCLANDAESGYRLVLDELVAFYQTKADIGIKLEPANPRKIGSRLAWQNKLFQRGTLCARVTVFHRGSGIDRNPPPAKAVQLYSVFFDYYGNDADRKSKRDADDFAEYWNRKNRTYA